jgi:nitrite reductase/ring-hydroxylating ferredoxin subunit
MESDAARLGRYGSIWAAQTVVYTAPTGTFFCAFTALSATVFASLGFDNGTTFVVSPGSVAATNTNCTFAGASSTLAQGIPAGCTIYGMWTSFRLTSGAVIAYKVASKAYAFG